MVSGRNIVHNIAKPAIRKPRIVPASEAPTFAHIENVSANGSLKASRSGTMKICAIENTLSEQSVQVPTMMLNELLKKEGASL
jgi:hypothetical protein